MTYDTFNELLEISSSTPVKVFEYTNITTSRLFINKFDLLPDIYFAKHGKVRITKNGITIYENNLSNNSLLKYSQFPIRAEIPFLDREDILKIFIHDYHPDITESTLIKLGISLELDFEDIPISSVLIPFTIQQLSQISIKKILFPEKTYVNAVSEKYYKELNIIGYDNLLFTILSQSQFSPQLISEIHNAPPVDFLDKLEDGYWGNKLPLTKSGTVNSVNGISWNYEHHSAGSISNKRELTGIYIKIYPTAITKFNNKLIVSDILKVLYDFNYNETTGILSHRRKLTGTLGIRSDTITKFNNKLIIGDNNAGKFYDFDYNEKESSFEFYDKNNDVFNPTNINGIYDSDVTIFDTNNLLNINKTYSFILSSSSDFDIDVKFTYLSSAFYTYSQSRRGSPFVRRGQFKIITGSGNISQSSNYRFSLKGKRIFSHNVNKIIAEGSNSQDFSNATVLFERDNYGDSNLNVNFSTTFRYIRFRKIITYNLTVEDYIESINFPWTYSTSIRSVRLPSFRAVPYLGLIDILNNLPTTGQEYLPNRVIGYSGVLFPDYAPDEIKSFLQTTKNITNNPDKLSFSKNEVSGGIVGNIKLGLESKGTNNEWFEILETIGTINTTEKTIQNLKEFSINNNIIIPKGEHILRAVLTVLGNLKMSVDVVLS